MNTLFYFFDWSAFIQSESCTYTFIGRLLFNQKDVKPFDVNHMEFSTFDGNQVEKTPLPDHSCSEQLLEFTQTTKLCLTQHLLLFTIRIWSRTSTWTRLRARLIYHLLRSWTLIQNWTRSLVWNHKHWCHFFNQSPQPQPLIIFLHGDLVFD